MGRPSVKFLPLDARIPGRFKADRGPGKPQLLQIGIPVTRITPFAGLNCYVFINTETRSNEMTDLLVRTALFITLTIGSSAIMALPYVA